MAGWKRRKKRSIRGFRERMDANDYIKRSN